MKKVFLYLHTHWDREWYREFEEFRLRLIEVVDDVVKKLQTKEIPSFYFDGQTAAIEDYLEIYPEKKELIKNLIKEKRLFIGPFYCSADSLLVSAEFLIRNLSIGIKTSQEFGCNQFIGYLSDTFGHSACMPEILKYCNIKSAMLWRGLGNLPSEFIWKNLPVTYLIQGYFQDILSIKTDIDKKAELLEKFIDKISSRSSENILLPCGADHLKVADNIKQQIEEINKRLKNYNLILSTPFEYLQAVEKNHKKTYEGEFLDQSKNFLLKGVYSSRIYQKQQNAKCQWELSRITEPLASLCQYLNISKSWQNEIDYAYKKLIKNHAHDSIYGCSTDDTHKDVERRFAQTLQITNGIKKRLIRDLASPTDEIKVFNLSNFLYSGIVEIATEKKLSKKYNAQLISSQKAFPDKKLYSPDEIPITEDITQINKYLIEVENIAPFSISSPVISKKRTLKITDKSIENDFIALEVKNKKIIVKDKVKNKIYNNFIEINDRADIGDSYNFGALKDDKASIAKLVSSKILKNGKIKSTLRLTYEINIPRTSFIKTLKRSKNTIKHKIYTDVSLTNTANYLEFNINWTNKSQNHISQVKINLEKEIKETHSEDLTGIIKRKFAPDYDIYKLIPAPKGIELKTNTAPMQRFVWANGVGIVTKGLNEYEIAGKSLSITILRATGIISEPHNPTRGTPAGPPIVCNDLQCLGENNANFTIEFTDNPQNLYKTAEKFYGCTIPFFGELEIKEILKIENKNILVQNIKSISKNEIAIRLVNVSTSSQILNFNQTDIFKNTYIGDVLDTKLKPAPQTIEMAPNSIKTIICQK